MAGGVGRAATIREEKVLAAKVMLDQERITSATVKLMWLELSGAGVVVIWGLP
jgi:hypothetical protein